MAMRCLSRYLRSRPKIDASLTVEEVSTEEVAPQSSLEELRTAMLELLDEHKRELTARDIEVAHGLLEGEGVRAIARRRDLDPKQVRRCVETLQRVLGFERGCLSSPRDRSDSAKVAVI
ncbi:MAG: hypothetical protein JNM84_26310 [Planctomycetes bacterium]|nr:hypothetical protein [Planctomycetota bacterium]